ncbi:MAG: fasciclin domain-containing protein [Bacteroidota bacterium]|nr:fasciclin domain-containing protein [Bacteroidota bacterium]
MKTIKLLFFAALISVTAASCSKDDDDDNQPMNPVDNKMDIVETAVADEQFSSLVAALQKAGLAETLKGDGPFTVFAPTNEAFLKFLSAAGFNTLDEVPNEVLTQILLNHVVSGNYLSTDLSTTYVPGLAIEETTSNNISLYIDLSDGVNINGSAMVTKADIEASNGVIHVVDAVIGIPTVVTHALANPDFSILVEALTRADLTTDFVSVLSGKGPFTVFAPTNGAFAALLENSDSWNNLEDIPVETLEAVLTYHVVNGANVLSGSLSDGQQVTSFNGEDFTININGGNVSITDANERNANVIAVDVQAGNGVIHVIDTVILP